MTPDQLYGELEGLVDRLGIVMRDDLIEEGAAGEGGLYTLNGKSVLILDRRLNWDQKNRVILAALGKLNLESVYIKPLIREMIEGGD